MKLKINQTIAQEKLIQPYQKWDKNISILYENRVGPMFTESTFEFDGF